VNAMPRREAKRQHTDGEKNLPSGQVRKDSPKTAGSTGRSRDEGEDPLFTAAEFERQNPEQQTPSAVATATVKSAPKRMSTGCGTTQRIESNPPYTVLPSTIVICTSMFFNSSSGHFRKSLVTTIMSANLPGSIDP